MIEYALAVFPKIILSKSVVAESETWVVFDMPKVAISEAVLGTVAGVQFAATFQSPVVGFRFQVALPA